MWSGWDPCVNVVLLEDLAAVMGKYGGGCACWFNVVLLEDLAVVMGKYRWGVLAGLMLFF